MNLLAARQRRGLILLAIVALGLRLALVMLLGAHRQETHSYEHGEIAANLLAGKGFSVKFLGVEGKTSQQAPLYPALLAVLYALLGVESTPAMLVMQILQCLVGTLLVLGVFVLARALAPTRPAVAWAAGWGAAIYPSHIYMITHLQIACWASCGLTWLVALCASPIGRGRWSKAISLGVLAGTLLLLDPILALALPVAALLYWQNERSAGVPRTAARNDAAQPAQSRRITLVAESIPRDEQGAWGRAACLAAVCLAVVAPWLWRNLRVHGEFVFVKSSFGYAFWQGNNAASWGTDKIPKPTVEALRVNHDGSLASVNRALWEARHETLYIDDVLLKPHGYREFQGLTEPQRSRLLGKRAWEFVRSHPEEYWQLCLRRLRYFLLFDETNPKSANRIYRIATVTWLLLSFVGLLVARRQGTRIWPGLAIFSLITAFHVLTISSARFRIPIEPLSFVWAGQATCAALACARRILPVPRAKANSAHSGVSGQTAASHWLQGPHRRRGGVPRGEVSRSPPRR